jgi:IS30 family transposase
MRRMANITDEENMMVEKILINHLLKQLGFRTPAEFFHQSLSHVALRS